MEQHELSDNVGGSENGITTLGKGLVISYKTKRCIIPGPRNSTPKHLLKKNENIGTYTDLYANIHSHLRVNSYNLKTAWWTFNRRMDKL